MLIPIGTTMEHKKQPIVTYWIIGLNVLIFAIQWAVNRGGGLNGENDALRFLAQLEFEGQLSKSNFHIWSLFTYQFLHAGWMHILLNMIFLLPFGKAVEGRMGHIGFAIFYLGCGAIGGFVHTLLYVAPVVGASGSVCAVVAAFIVLAPKTHIHVLLIFFIIGIYTIPSMLLVGFFVLLDTFNLLASVVTKNNATTAWVVHLVGYAGGFLFTFLALLFGFIRSSEFDLTQVINQFRRRRSLQKVIEANPVFKNSVEEVANPDFQLRTLIAQQASSGKTDQAAKTYFDSIKKNPTLKIDPRTFHTLGSSLLELNRVEEGVLVFEGYLKQYKEAKDRGEVALLLAAKYTRILQNKKRASELLKKYAADFSEQHQELAVSIQKEITS
jgi:membrane associated rhomboid family serine protease